MSYPINYPTPQGANVQIFRGGVVNTNATRDWVKPQGASFVWFTLIGAGGGGAGNFQDSAIPAWYPGGGGASGNVTNFMCPAFLLPDVLQVAVGAGGYGGVDAVDATADPGIAGNATVIYYQQKNGAGYELLKASGGGGGAANGGGGTGGTAAAANTGGPMTAAGFYNSVAGQNGATGGNAPVTITTNGLTFLMGGNGKTDNIDVITGYYGYTATLRNGYSQLSPIPLAIPNNSTTGSFNKSISQSFGCGGNGGGSSSGGGSGGTGGHGLAIIVTW